MAVLSTSSAGALTSVTSGARAGVAQEALPIEQHQTPVQRLPITQQTNRTPGAIAALTPVLGSRPAQQPDAPGRWAPDSPEALPVTARTPASSTPATQPAASIPAAEGASPEAPATQPGAEEEPALTAEASQRLLLVFDGRPYVLRAEDVIGLAMPDTLTGEQPSERLKALRSRISALHTSLCDATCCAAEQFSSECSAMELSFAAVPCAAEERPQVAILTAHVCLAARPSSHATTEPEAARSLDTAALSR